MTLDLDTLDPTFLADLRESRKAVEVMAHWLASRGYPVIVRPTFERPDASQWREYADEGDLEIVQRVEVKHRSFAFTGKSDYPYSTVIVDNARRFDKKRPKPFAYVILNHAMDAALFVECKTRRHWTCETKHVRGTERVVTVYECPLKYVTTARIEATS